MLNSQGFHPRDFSFIQELQLHSFILSQPFLVPRNMHGIRICLHYAHILPFDGHAQGMYIEHTSLCVAMIVVLDLVCRQAALLLNLHLSFGGKYLS